MNVVDLRTCTLGSVPVIFELEAGEETSLRMEVADMILDITSDPDVFELLPSDKIMEEMYLTAKYLVVRGAYLEVYNTIRRRLVAELA